MKVYWRGPFGYPDVGRAGLGNALFPWARCIVWCQQTGVPMLAPRWRRFRLGPYLRRERDSRQYHRMLGNGDAISGWRRWAALATLRRLGEEECRDRLPSSGELVVFRGMDGLFDGLRGQQDAIRRSLLECARPFVRERCAALHAPFIGVHVRLGDYRPGNDKELRAGVWNRRLPIEWYVAAIRELRKLATRTVVIKVFTDGSPTDVSPLLEIGAELHRLTTALEDMLTLSKAKALVASGSTFSMWASYLGQMPTLWYPGQRRQTVLAAQTGELEPEWEPGTPLPDAFGRALSARVT